MHQPSYIDRLMTEIIPPSNYRHREGFSNRDIIDGLTDPDRAMVERALIEALPVSNDLLIIETLAYMKSTACLPMLYQLIDRASNESQVIIIASSLYSINHDARMIETAVDAFKRMEARGPSYMKYRVLPLFYYLRSFRSTTTDAILERYASSTEYLWAYNAREALQR